MAMTKTRADQVYGITRYAVLTFWLLICAFPIYWIVATSFKPDREWEETGFKFVPMLRALDVGGGS